jgi:hypothetical protein
MLRIADQHARRRKTELGTNPGVSGGQSGCRFKAHGQKALYEWVKNTLCAQEYSRLYRSARGLVKRYLAKVTGRSRAQVTRLIRQYLDSGNLQSRRGRGRRFTARYNATDLTLWAEVDEAHETVSGPATHRHGSRAWFPQRAPSVQDRRRDDRVAEDRTSGLAPMSAARSSETRSGLPWRQPSNGVSVIQ